MDAKNSLVIMLGSRIVAKYIASLLPGSWWVGFFEFVSNDLTLVLREKHLYFRGEKQRKVKEVLNVQSSYFKILFFKMCT